MTCGFRTLSLMLLLSIASPARGQTTLLHEFSREPDDGAVPFGALTLVDDTLFGTTTSGGGGLGTVFSLKTDGSSFNVWHVFQGAPDDGAVPRAGLTGQGDLLFGTTSVGGANDLGTVYSIATDGSGFQVLHDFTAAHGTTLAGLAVSGNRLYGATLDGGAAGLGAVFSINTDGSDFKLLHEFTGDDGATPYGRPIVNGSTLFGTTRHGGEEDVGTVFSIGIDGTGFQPLHTFIGSDGALPLSGLTLVGGVLFGTTRDGGVNNLGTVFSLHTDGTGFEVLHEFAGTDGSEPRSDLIWNGDRLFGTTRVGGASGVGTVFSLATDGSRFQVIHDFAGGANDGGFPMAGVTLVTGALYGATSGGGDSAAGTLFALPVPTISWQNPDEPLDVNAIDGITPLDALLVINELSDRILSDPVTGELVLPATPPPYVDVTGDGFAAPLDALLVINGLGSESAAAAAVAVSEPGPTAWGTLLAGALLMAWWRLRERVGRAT